MTTPRGSNSGGIFFSERSLWVMVWAGEGKLVSDWFLGSCGGLSRTALVVFLQRLLVT